MDQRAPDRIALLINPCANRGRAIVAAHIAFAYWRSRGVQVRRIMARTAGEARALAHAALVEGCDALVACGGDGTVHAAVQAALADDAPLGVIPAGRGNDYARMVGTPTDTVAAARAVLAGPVRRIDVGIVGARAMPGTRAFTTVLGCGFDSRVAGRMNQLKLLHGPTGYYLSVLAELVAFRPIAFSLTLDGRRIDLDAMLVAVGNGSCYGSGMHICPAADPTDGLFDVTVVTRLGRAELVRLLPTVYSGAHVLRPEVRTFRAARVTIAASGITGIADGEHMGPLPLTAHVRPRALKLIGAARAFAASVQAGPGADRGAAADGGETQP